MALDFDVEGALKAGATKSQIAEYLAARDDFDIDGARSAGATDDQIFAHLTKSPGILETAKDILGRTVSAVRAVLPGMEEEPSSVMNGYIPKERPEEGAPGAISRGLGPMRKSYADTAEAVMRAQPLTETQRLAEIDTPLGNLAKEVVPQQERRLYGDTTPRTTGDVFADVAEGTLPPPSDEFDKPAWSDAAEVGRQTWASLINSTPQMAAQAGQWWHPEGSIEEKYFAEAVKYFAGKEKEWAPDLEGRGPIAEYLIKGAGQLGPSLVTMGATAANPWLGVALTGVLFGGQQAQDTYDKRIKAGVSPAEAFKAAMLTGGIEAGGETLSNFLSLKLLFSPLKALGGAETLSGVVKTATSPAWVKQFAKNWAADAFLQSVTEYGQGWGETKIENLYGLSKDSPHEQGKEGALTALGMSTLLGPLGGVSHSAMGKQRALLGLVLNDPSAPLDMRLAAADYVAGEIEANIGKREAEIWKQAFTEGAIQDRDARTNVFDSRNIDEAIAASANALSAPLGAAIDPYKSADLDEQPTPTGIINSADLPIIGQEPPTGAPAQSIELPVSASTADVDLAARTLAERNAGIVPSQDGIAALRRVEAREAPALADVADEPGMGGRGAFVTDLRNTVEEDRARRVEERSAADLANTEITETGGVRYSEPRIIAGQPAAAFSDDQLRTLAQDINAHANTRQAAMAALQARQERAREDFTLSSHLRPATAEDLPGERVTAPMRGFLQQLGRLTGTRVEFAYLPKSREGESHFARVGNTIYINTTSRVNPLAIMGHEVTHILEAKMPEAWVAIRSALSKTLGEGAQRRAALEVFARDYLGGEGNESRLAALLAISDWTAPLTQEQLKAVGINNEKTNAENFLLREMVSDLGGNHWKDEKFWTGVFEDINKRHGSDKAKGIIERLVGTIKETLNKFLMLARQDGYRTISKEQLEGTRAAVTKAFADWIEAERLTEPMAEKRETATTEEVTAALEATAAAEDLETARAQELDELQESPRRAAGGARGEATVTDPKEQEKIRAFGFAVRRNAVSGAPGFIHTLADIKKQINRAVADALSDRSHPEDAIWYREAGRAIREYSHGDRALMEKLTRVVAKLSQAAGVDTNVTQVIKVAYQLANGEIPAAGRFPNMFQEFFTAAISAPEFDTSLHGVNRKLQNFYRNLHDEAFQENRWPDAVVVDRHAAGYVWNDNSHIAVTDPEYTYAETVIQKSAIAYNKKTKENLKPRDMQALLWGWWKREDSKGAINGTYTTPGAAWNYPQFFERATANVTHETLPSTKVSNLDAVLSLKEKRQFHKEAMALILDEDGQNLLAKKAGLVLYKEGESTGGYENKINPNEITGAIARKTSRSRGDSDTYHRYHFQDIDRYALGLQYIYKQDGVPWFRADRELDPATLDKARANREKRIAAGSKVAEGNAPPQMSQGYFITFDRNLTDAEEAVMFDALRKDIGEEAGYTKMAPDLIAVINYRGEDGKPFLMSDADFKAAIENFRHWEHVKLSEPFAAESRYHYHDFHADPQAAGILAANEIQSAEPGFRSWLAGRREAYDALVSRWEAGRPNAASGKLAGGGAATETSASEIRPDAISAVGIHYSRAQRESLSSSAFSTGLGGAERERLATATDPRLLHRIYFYINDGKGITPESGVGAHAHQADLSNLYDMDADPRNIAAASKDGNAFESTVLDEGYSGYLSGERGVAVQLGQRTTPVEYLGIGGEHKVPRVAHANPSEYHTALKALAAERGLPMGKLTGEDWKRLIPKILPQIDVSHLDNAKSYYKDQLVPRPEISASEARALEKEDALPGRTQIHRAIDGAELATLRRAAARLESPEDGTFLHITADGLAIATGRPRYKIPAAFHRFAEEHNLTFTTRRQGINPDIVNPRFGETSDVMPDAFSSSGAKYAAEIGNRFIDRTGKTRFSESRQPSLDQAMTDDWDNIKARLKKGEQIRDTEGKLLAPNGRLSNLTEKQHAEVRTPEFLLWFGDWLAAHNGKDGNGVWALPSEAVSKVVDANGEPLVVHHGTLFGGFTILDPERSDDHRSSMIFTAEDRITASSYSGRTAEIRLPPGRTAEEQARYDTLLQRDTAEGDLTSEEQRELEELYDKSAPIDQRGVYSLYLNIREPNETDFQGANWDGQYLSTRWQVVDENGDVVDSETYDDVGDAQHAADAIDGASIEPVMHRFETTNDIAEEALRMGMDGAIIYNVLDDGGHATGYVDTDNVYVFFKANQAKSATQNTGEFSAGSADLRHSERRAWYYSQLEEAVSAIPAKVRTGNDIAMWLRSNQSKLGIKKEELEWSGLLDWLRMNGKALVSPEQVRKFLEENGIKVNDVVLNRDFDEDNPELPDNLMVIDADELDYDDFPMAKRYRYAVLDVDSSDPNYTVYGFGNTEEEAIQEAYASYPEKFGSGDNTKFGKWVLPGGENYKELLITLPLKQPPPPERLKTLPQEYELVYDGTQEPFNRWIVSLRDEASARPFAGRYPTAEQATAAALQRINADTLEKHKAALQRGFVNSDHYDEPNILAHIRFNERFALTYTKAQIADIGKRIAAAVGAKRVSDLGSGAPGVAVKKGVVTQLEANQFSHFRQFNEPKEGALDRVLFLEEVQSDWGQEGRERGFDTPAKMPDGSYRTPTAPFVTDTQAWTALGLKRAIAYAVDNGFSRIAWSTGEQQADRYSLRKRLDSIQYKVNNDGRYLIIAKAINGKVVLNDIMDLEKLKRTVGKELAEKIVAGEGKDLPSGTEPAGYKNLSGLDLEIGSDGMLKYYGKEDPLAPVGVDKAGKPILSILTVVAKKLGVEFSPVQINQDHDASKNEQLPWDTDAVRAILRRGGEVYTVDRSVSGETNISTEAELDAHLEQYDPYAYILGDKQGTTTQPGFVIPEALKKQIQEKGFPLFSEQRPWWQQTRPEVAPSWRDKFHVQKQDSGKYRVASNYNMNPISPAFATPKEAEQWAEDFTLRESPMRADDSGGGFLPDDYLRPIGVPTFDLGTFKGLPIRLRSGNVMSSDARNLHTGGKTYKRGYGLVHIYDTRKGERFIPEYVKGNEAENIARFAYTLAQTYNRAYDDGGKYVLWNRNKSAALVVQEAGPRDDRFWSIVTIKKETAPRGTGIENVRSQTFDEARLFGAPSSRVPENLSPDTLDTLGNQSEVILNEKGELVKKATPASGVPVSIKRKRIPMYESPPRSSLTGNQITPTWTPPPVVKWDSVIREMQDKLVDTKQVLKAIRAAGVAVKEQFDPYLKEILFHGRAANQVTMFANHELRPLLEEMNLRKIGMPELEDYLWARHAVERNQQIASINPAMPDGGSGLTNQQAMDVMAGQAVTVGNRTLHLDLGKMTGYRALAQRVDAITRGTTDLLVSSGLETQDTINAWRRTYQNYVPLMRDMEADDNYSGAFSLGIGQGFNVRGSSSKRAMGSEREAIDIFANVAMQRERAIVRAEKNRIAKAVYGLALTAPNPGFWAPVNPDMNKRLSPAGLAAAVQELVQLGLNPIDAENLTLEPTQPYIDPNTGLVTHRINPAMRGRDNVLAARIDGKDRYVFFSSNDRAVAMVRNLKNLDNDNLSMGLAIVAKVTRYFASINTQYNPVFGLTNGIRDSGTALLNLGSTPLAGKQRELAKNAMSALRGVYSDLRAERAGRTATSRWSQIYEEFAAEGGQTGYRDLFATSKERAEAIAEELKNAGKGQHWLALGEKRSHVFGWLSDYNTAIENAWRVGAYKLALDNGMSKAHAAEVAKNLTVNFNKKGLAATEIGALYAFFNVAVQGTARIATTMVKDGKLTRMGQKVLYGGLLLGVMQAVLSASADWDDDNPPQFIREKNLVIPLPGGRYVSAPYPLGFHIFPNIGRLATEYVLSGFRNPGKRLVNLANVILDAFNPIGSGGFTQMLSPTLTDPAVALWENKDWTGKDIAKQDMDKMHPTPGWTRAKDTATTFAKGAAYATNFITGGGSYGIGVLSPTPDQIDYLVGQATGGVGREVMKVEQTISSAVTGEELPAHKRPVLGRFYGDTTGQASEASRFYSNLKRIGEHKSAINLMKENGDDSAIDNYLKNNPDALLVKLADKAAYKVRKLQTQKREALKQGIDVKDIEARITEVMREYNQELNAR